MFVACLQHLQSAKPRMTNLRHGIQVRACYPIFLRYYFIFKSQKVIIATKGLTKELEAYINKNKNIFRYYMIKYYNIIFENTWHFKE